MTIVDDNAAYEKWLGDWCDVVQADLDYKHDRMKLNPFAFLRATFFRWAKVIPVALNELTFAPSVLSVGDAHVENFGTWLAANGNEIWGVNDFDDATSIPYPFDLVRLATSAVLVPQTTSTEAQVSAAILEGYRQELTTPRPTVVTEAPDWMQAQLIPTREDKHFLERAAAKNHARYGAARYSADAAGGTPRWLHQPKLLVASQGWWRLGPSTVPRRC